jgi:hypothetical protein
MATSDGCYSEIIGGSKENPWKQNLVAGLSSIDCEPKSVLGGITPDTGKSPDPDKKARWA